MTWSPAWRCSTQQLIPELSEELLPYERVVFLDVHIPGVDWDEVYWQELAPRLKRGMITNSFSPGPVLAYCQSLYQHTPQAFALSMLGDGFNFGNFLSPAAAQRADQAVELLLHELDAG